MVMCYNSTPPLNGNIRRPGGGNLRQLANLCRSSALRLGKENWNIIFSISFAPSKVNAANSRVLLYYILRQMHNF